MSRKSILEKMTDHFNIIFLIILLITFIYNYFNGIHDKYFRIILTAVLVSLVNIIYIKFFSPKYKMNYNIILFFIFASMYAGNILNLYKFIYFYDKILHFISGIALGYIGFDIVQNNLNISEHKLFTFIFIMSFGAGCAGLWEIYEFITDAVFGFTSQNSSLKDTMYDIICGILGCLIWLVYYFWLIKQKINNKKVKPIK